MTDKDLYGGLIRLHILHHAAEEPVFGLVGIIEELRHHGYEMSAGTLYPMLRCSPQFEELHNAFRTGGSLFANDPVSARANRLHGGMIGGTRGACPPSEAVF